MKIKEEEREICGMDKMFPFDIIIKLMLKLKIVATAVSLS